MDSKWHFHINFIVKSIEFPLFIISQTMLTSNICNVYNHCYFTNTPISSFRNILTFFSNYHSRLSERVHLIIVKIWKISSSTICFFQKLTNNPSNWFPLNFKCMKHSGLRVKNSRPAVSLFIRCSKTSCLFVLTSQFLDKCHNIFFRSQSGAFCFSSHFLLKRLHRVHSWIIRADHVCTTFQKYKSRDFPIFYYT